MFATRLKELRLEQDLTQAELASRLKVKPSVLGMWEQNRRMPEVKTIVLIADYFGVTVDYILDRTNIKERFKNENLRRLRGQRSIEEFANTLNISVNLLTRFEEGKEIPNSSFLEYIAEIEKVDVDYFFTNRDNIFECSNKTVIDSYDENIKKWILSSDSKEYIEFIYKIFEQGFPKEMLSKSQMLISMGN